MLSQDHSSFSTGGWCSIYPTKLLHKLSGTISGKLIYVAVILPGFFQWLWCVTGKDTLSMQCSLHVWIPQQLTDSVYGSARGERGFRMLEIWYKQSCVFLMEMRMHSNIMGVIQANTDTLLHWFWIWFAFCSCWVFASSDEDYWQGRLAGQCTSMGLAVCTNGYRERWKERCYLATSD